MCRILEILEYVESAMLELAYNEKYMCVIENAQIFFKTSPLLTRFLLTNEWR